MKGASLIWWKHPKEVNTVMKEKELKNEGLADLAHKVEKDLEVQNGPAELYKIGKYAIKLP